MPRKQKKQHFIYKTTCKLNGNFYYGMHSTNNLDDGYLGSGTRISRSIKKHGKDNHLIERLEFLESRLKLKEREAEIVNEDFIKDPSCMNLKPGGYGGFNNKEHQLKCSLAGSSKGGKMAVKKRQLLFIDNPEFKQEFYDKISKSLIGRESSFKGRKHSEETKKKMALADRTGNKNSQYGTCWITDEKKSKKIFKGDLIPEGWRLGRNIIMDENIKEESIVLPIPLNHE